MLTSYTYIHMQTTLHGHIGCLLFLRGSHHTGPAHAEVTGGVLFEVCASLRSFFLHGLLQQPCNCCGSAYWVKSLSAQARLLMDWQVSCEL
mgnify:CR=1 FL=1